MGELIVVLRHKKGLMLLALGLTSVGLVGCGNQNTEVVNEQVSIETESVVEESVKVVNEPVSLDIASLVNSEAKLGKDVFNHQEVQVNNRYKSR